MPELGEGRIEVLTFKRGLLSKVAHDLCLRLERFELQVDADRVRVRGRFWPDSLVVAGVMHGDKLDEGALSASDRREIAGNIREKILHTARHPEARLDGTLERATERGAQRHLLRGDLELAGQRAPIEIPIDVDERDGHARGEVELVPSRWGIAPFKALLGAIQLQDRVIVRFDFQVTD